MYYKVEANDDILIFEANSLEEAQTHFRRVMGEIPEEILTWTEIEIDEIPEGILPLSSEVVSSPGKGGVPLF